MARINVEDSLFKSKRFLNLVIKTGDVDRALGAMVRAWALAQKFWLSPSQLIPREAWDKEELHPGIIECGLAEERDQGVYVSGSKEQFGWLEQRSEAGKKPKAKSKGKPRKRPIATDNDRVSDGNGSKPLSLSLSPSPSHSLSSVSISISEEEKPSPGASRPVAGKSVVSTKETWDAYCEAYSRRYKTAPVRNASVNGMLAQLVKRLGTEEAPLVAAFYLTHNDQFYVRSLHPVGLMLRDAEKLRTEWKTGRRVTTAAARQIDRKQATFDAFAPLIAEAEERECREKEASRG